MALELPLPLDRFLAEYWQRKPLLIRGGLPGYRAPLSPEDLAGLSMEEDSLARLVQYRRRADRWSVRHGPFVEADFAALPDRDWTLLVQDVDRWDPGVAALLAHFRFLPRWRLDDVMVSYAVAGGSVGAHVDQYDVFLVQGLGRRHWMWDDSAGPALGFRPDVPLKLLQHFIPTDEAVLEPGDILYLPPGVPHHGVALDPCLTLSVGLRAPSVAELWQARIGDWAETLDDSLRYADPGLMPAEHPGELDDVAVERLAALLQAHRPDDDAASLRRCFGRMLSTWRQARVPEPPARKLGERALTQRLAAGGRLRLDAQLRPIWYREAGAATLWLQGRAFRVRESLATGLCAGVMLDADAWAALDVGEQQALREAYNEGCLRWQR
ncbi:MAG: cupin domain-containing protein [Xanthomonadales bacterium]|jgi:50S ribosomal protein L16 3-hydroxylase|nr:cupin domain-containing protein [Xanthomonadales bacterium]